MIDVSIELAKNEPEAVMNLENNSKCLYFKTKAYSNSSEFTIKTLYKKNSPEQDTKIPSKSVSLKVHSLEKLVNITNYRR